MQKFFFDIFKGGRFFTTVFLLFPRNWQFTEKEIVDGIIDKYPSLRNQEFSLSPA